MSAAVLECIRSDCEQAPKDGLDVCEAHHQEILIGLDECKAVGCDKRVPFGSLWCKRHAAMRSDGSLSVDGVDLSAKVEGTRCRICGDPAILRTVGKRPQGGWNDLCQVHFDEKRATHSESLAVARAHLPTPNGKAAKPESRVSIPDSGIPKGEPVPHVHLKPGDTRRVVPPPVDERERRATYLLAHDWATASSYAGEEDRWFLPVNVTQPMGGRSLDEAYDWQVAVESGRAQHELITGTTPDRTAHAPRCGLDTDHDGECVIGEPEEHEPTALERLEADCLPWCTLPIEHSGPCKDFAGRTVKDRIEGAITEIVVPPVDPQSVIHEAVLTPTMEWSVHAAEETPAQRVLDAYARSISDALSAWGCELALPENPLGVEALAAHAERMLKIAPGIRLAVELLAEHEILGADAVPSGE